jgi:hypothetical protein
MHFLTTNSSEAKKNEMHQNPEVVEKLINLNYVFFFIYVIFNNSACISETVKHFSATKTSWLKMFKETITVYSEHNTKSINTKRRIIDC